mmetsp:Transcript_40789/g.108769  ORF Transcript_40789/g.108769 Transcript_40789/m.108769 type:complete len:355 (+) Transcript_40789:152-1216(+)
MRFPLSKVHRLDARHCPPRPRSGPERRPGSRRCWRLLPRRPSTLRLCRRSAPLPLPDRSAAAPGPRLEMRQHWALLSCDLRRAAMPEARPETRRCWALLPCRPATCRPHRETRRRSALPPRRPRRQAAPEVRPQSHRRWALLPHPWRCPEVLRPRREVRRCLALLPHHPHRAVKIANLVWVAGRAKRSPPRRSQHRALPLQWCLLRRLRINFRPRGRWLLQVSHRLKRRHGLQGAPSLQLRSAVAPARPRRRPTRRRIVHHRGSAGGRGCSPRDRPPGAVEPALRAVDPKRRKRPTYLRRNPSQLRHSESDARSCPPTALEMLWRRQRTEKLRRVPRQGLGRTIQKVAHRSLAA